VTSGQFLVRSPTVRAGDATSGHVTFGKSTSNVT
jgi:hypothetical protein